MNNEKKNKSVELIKSFSEPIRKSQVTLGVEENIQQAELEFLRETIRHQRFFFVVDLATQSILHPHGIKEWLGYDESTFSFQFYSSLIHQNHLEPVLLLSKSIFELVFQKKVDIAFMRDKYTIDIALRHANGHYMLVRRTLSCWNFDLNTQMPTAYLNEFTILENYEEEHSRGIRPRITDLYNNRVKNYEDFVRETSSKTLESKKKFSFQELRILRKYAYNQDLNSKNIAEAFKISTATVDTHHRRIIQKFNNIYPSHEMKSAKDIAQFLRKEYFI